jgi:very-short-patch-repair endonuclease
MFDMLAERGFRIDTQVPVGNFRIDLVVEGENDRRLAIECDGDRYHGPDKWSEDMVRQRILERAGWEIWRCFASRFVRDRDGVLSELLSLFRERGIEPIGTSEGWISRHTEQRRWRTPTPDDKNILFGSESEADENQSMERTRPAVDGTGIRGVVPIEAAMGAAAFTSCDSDEALAAFDAPLNGFTHSNGSRQYILAAFSGVGIEPRPDLLYENEYRPTLRRLIGHVITVEGPIYGDILAVRIARAHGKDRTGSTIQQLVFSAIDDRFPRTREEDRDLFWPEGARTDTAFPYRPALEGVRSHSDTPLAELASIALPFLRVPLSEEDIIQKMTEHFRLERLRRATRERFEAALAIAKRSWVV